MSKVVLELDVDDKEGSSLIEAVVEMIGLYAFELLYNEDVDFFEGGICRLKTGRVRVIRITEWEE